MTIGVSKESLESLHDAFDENIHDKVARIYFKTLVRLLIESDACKELNPWLPIAEAPKGEPGFLAINDSLDRIEWLVDYGEQIDKFYNSNNNSFILKKQFTHYMALSQIP